jgi:hypothetical protein
MKAYFLQRLFIFFLAQVLFMAGVWAQDASVEIDQFRSSANLDTVSKILNYTEGLEEGGSDNSFWYAYDAKACIYRKAGLEEHKIEEMVTQTNAIAEDSNFNQMKTETKTLIELNTNIRELKLNTWAPSTVRVGYVQDIGTWWGPNNYYLQLIANGNLIMQSSKPRDVERTKAAWDMVFNRFCPGVRNYF